MMEDESPSGSPSWQAVSIPGTGFHGLPNLGTSVFMQFAGHFPFLYPDVLTYRLDVSTELQGEKVPD